jgi:hypothetical protein
MKRMVNDASHRAINSIKTIGRTKSEHASQKQFENLKWVGGNQPFKNRSATYFKVWHVK